MTKAQCYKILGLEQGATEAEIRRRYKKMAMRVHPDINPDPNAHEQFIQLSLAVEILLNPGKESASGRTSRSTSKKNENFEGQKARMEEAKMRYEEQKRRKQAEDDAYFSSLTTGKKWSLYKWVVRVGVVFAAILVLDSFLPHHVESDKIERFSTVDHNGLRYPKICAIYFENRGSYYVKQNRANWFASYPEVKIYTTWLLHTPMEFEVSDDFQTYKTGFDFYSGSIKWLLIGLLLLPLFPYLKRYKKLSFVFLYQLSFWGIGTLEVFLLLTEYRLGHLLSLGFL